MAERPFDVMIIPFTWEHTNLAPRGGRATAVNLECDMVGKYVARGVELAEARLAAVLGQAVGARFSTGRGTR